VFLDASAQEESACPDRLHCFFTGEGRLCGLRMEGSAGLEVKRIRGLLEVSRGRSGVCGCECGCECECEC
jgi:exosome complex component RRP42